MEPNEVETWYEVHYRLPPPNHFEDGTVGPFDTYDEAREECEQLPATYTQVQIVTENRYVGPHEGAVVSQMIEAGLQQRLHAECVDSGWDPTQANTFAEEIAHLHEEVSEAFRAFRQYHDFDVRMAPDGKPLGVPAEIADVLIGLFYIAERWGFDLWRAVDLKHQYNLCRDYVAEGRQLHGAEKEGRDVND